MYEAIKESQSLRKSGLCRLDREKEMKYEDFNSRNPFVNQVFVVGARTPARSKPNSDAPSQSLRKSGLCRRPRTSFPESGSTNSRNPFVNQVFVVNAARSREGIR